MSSRFASVLVVLACVVAGECQAQFFNQNDFIRNLYRSYLRREPSQGEVELWVRNMRGGMSQLDAQANILGSEEYFLRHQNNLQAVVVGFYQDILGRQPNANDVAIWSNNWRGDRLAYSRQFVSAAQQELAVRLIVPVQPLDLGARLVATAQHVGQAAQFELFGGFQGRRIQAQTNALTMACQNLRQALARQFPEAKWNAMIEAEASYEAMQESMRGQQFAAPRTSQHLGNLGQLLQEARRTLPGVAPQPVVAMSPFAGGIDAQTFERFARAYNSMTRAAQSRGLTTRLAAARDPSSNMALRDVEFFVSQMEAMQYRIRVGAPVAEIQATFVQVRQLAFGIQDHLRRVPAHPQVMGAWNMVGEEMTRFGGLIGVPTGGEAARNLFPEFIAAADQSIAQVDAFLAGFQPLVLYSPNSPRLISHGQALRGSIAQLRQEAALGATKLQLAGRLEEVNEMLRRTNAVLGETVAGDGLTFAPNLGEVGNAVGRLIQIFAAIP